MYKGRTFYREQIYVCGDYIDADVYPVFQKPGIRRKKSNPSTEIQARKNRRNSEKKITRIANLNFTPADIVIHLTYDDAPDDTQRALKNLRNFFDRVKRLRNKQALDPLKYLASTEVSAAGRIHHHVIMSGGIDRDVLEQMWGFGYANTKRLQFGEHGIENLAEYIAKGKLCYKRWSASRNLIKPEPIENDSVTAGEMRELVEAIAESRHHEYFRARFPGWVVVRAEHNKNAINFEHYVTYELRRIKKN